MDFGGRYRFSASRRRVWDALNDTAILKAAIPGCRSIDWTGGATLDLSIEVNFGLIRPVFSAELVLSDVHPAERYTLSGRGRGGLLGLAQAAAEIALADHAEGTILSFRAVGSADGRIMKLGRALVGSSAQRVIDGFFESVGLAMGVDVVPLEPEECPP